MKLLTFFQNGEPRMGVKTTRGIVDVNSMFPNDDKGMVIPRSIHDVIEGGQTAILALQQAIDHLPESSLPIVSETSLTIGPCVARPNKIICVGLNYRKHAEETKAQIPMYPILFNKFTNSLAGHREDIPLPRTSGQVDYEAELVIVMGKRAKYVSKEEALDYVFGYCCANDLSARDLQMRTSQWLLGKSCDKFSPLGPYLVTADEVGDPNHLTIKCTVNGDIRQHSNTSDMIFQCDEIVSYISQHMTLIPGDIILTGTPEGVILGYPQEKQVYLKDGDIVEVEIEKLGTLINRMVREV